MEVKAPQSKDWTQINEFLNKNLRASAPWSLKDEYPLAFSEKNMGNIRIIQEGERVLAHAVMKPNLIKTHYHLFKVGFIGSVVTDEACRGKGYSTQIVNSCLESARAQQCDFAMLWTDLFNFYAKLGFEVAGSEVALEIKPGFKAPPKDSLRIMDTNRVSPEAILKVYNKHNLRTLRQPGDVREYLKIPQSQIYTAWNKATNLIEAYCVVGKGADFNNYVHEWGGPVSSVMSLLEFIVDQRKQPVTLISPLQCTNLIKKLEEAGADKFFGILGMIHLTNPASFCKKVKKGARALGYDSFIFEHRDGIYYFGYGDEIYQTDSDQDIIRLAFGPLEPEQIHGFSPTALEALKEIFPIPFWVWGWDSI